MKELIQQGPRCAQRLRFSKIWSHSQSPLRGFLQQLVELIIGLRDGGAVHPGPDKQGSEHNNFDTICEHLEY